MLPLSSYANAASPLSLFLKRCGRCSAATHQRKVLAQKSVEGHTSQVQLLIRKYGADKLSQVDPAHYADLLHEAEVL